MNLYPGNESDAIISVVDVLENGSVADVIAGKPTNGEVFKQQ